MKQGSSKMVYVLAAGAFLLWVTPASAYLGPGAGLTAIGAFLALVAGILAAFFGFLWYPVKRFLRQRKAASPSRSDVQQQPRAEAIDKNA